MIDFTLPRKSKPVGAVLSESDSSDPKDTYVSVVTVRMSRSFHDRLIAAAHDARVSMNRLCLLSMAEGCEQAEAWAEKLRSEQKAAAVGP